MANSLQGNLASTQHGERVATLIESISTEKVIQHGRLAGGGEPSAAAMVIREATEQDRQEIYRTRHDVYAVELGQHPQNPDGLLKNHLDQFNRYFVAIIDGQMAGFISVTPPEGGEYSLDGYLDRKQWPFEDRDRLFEVRLLTVKSGRRGSLLATALMYASFRAVEASGGTRLVVIGRTEVASIYRSSGYVDHGIELVKGDVTFLLMSATVDQVRKQVEKRPQLVDRIEQTVDWQLSFPLRKPAACFHGGGFFEDVGDGFQSLSRREEIINADVLDAWFPAAPGVISTLSEHLDWLVRTSPPTGCEGLIAAIAAARGVAETSVLPGAGSSDLIFLAFNQCLSSSDGKDRHDP